MQHAAPHDASPPKYHRDIRFSVMVRLPMLLYFLPSFRPSSAVRLPHAVLTPSSRFLWPRGASCVQRVVSWDLTRSLLTRSYQSDLGGLWAPAASRALTPHDVRVGM